MILKISVKPALPLMKEKWYSITVRPLSPTWLPKEKLMKGIFHPDKWNDWDTPLPNVQEIKKWIPKKTNTISN